MIEAGVQSNRDLIVFSDANLLDELLQNGAAFIVVGGVVNIRPCKQLVADNCNYVQLSGSAPRSPSTSFPSLPD